MTTRAQELYRLRVSLGLTQHEACAVTGVKLSTWVKWEQGINDPSDRFYYPAIEALRRKENKR